MVAIQLPRLVRRAASFDEFGDHFMITTAGWGPYRRDLSDYPRLLFAVALVPEGKARNFWEGWSRLARIGRQMLAEAQVKQPGPAPTLSEERVLCPSAGEANRLPQAGSSQAAKQRLRRLN